jgi:hypothetical protein
LSLPARRPRVLLCWGYYRKGWIAPFEQLGDELDFDYIFYLSKEDEEASYTERPRHYWNDFRSAQQIIDELAPDRVVFMSLSGLRPIALNMAARRRGIPTFILQHGYFRSLENYLALAASSQATAPTNVSRQTSSPLRAVRFLMSSHFLREPLECLRALAMLAMSRRKSHYHSQLQFRFRGRMPDWYITYSESTSEIHRQLDGAEDGAIIPIGIPEFDPIFRRVAQAERAPGDSVLLIDSPTAENRYGVTSMTVDQKVRFLEELSSRLAARGRRLVVKLHPETYEAEWLPSSANTTYVRDADVASLIAQAGACLGFDSTLMIPAVIVRPTMLFELCESTLTEDARRLGVATVVRGLEYTDEQLDSVIGGGERPEANIEAFTRSFAHAADGRATERLAAAIREPGR